MLKSVITIVGMAMALFWSCADYRPEVHNIVFEYIKDYEDDLAAFEKKYPLVNDIQNLKLDAESLLKLSTQIINEVRSDERLDENAHFKNLSMKLQNLTEELHSACQSDSKSNVKGKLEKIRECYAELTTQMNRLSTKPNENTSQ